MTEDLRQQFELLQNEVSTLVHHFDEHEALFAKSKDRIDLLNETAPVFFRMVCDVLWADLLMQVSCITGPARTVMRKSTAENLSLRRLPALVHPSFQTEVQAAVDTAVARAEFTTAGRNKFYSHRDLPTALDANALGLTLGSRKQMHEAILAAEAVMHTLARAYGQPPVTFSPHVGWGIAEDLVELLQKGHEVSQQENAARRATGASGGGS